MLRGRQILVIDDSAVARATLQDLLAWEGAFVQAAADPYEAVACLKQRLPDAIILDLELPKMSGLVFLRKLMAQHPLPVVVVSGAVGPHSETAFQALEAGALEVVAKPQTDAPTDFDRWRTQTLQAVERAVGIGAGHLARMRRAKPATGGTEARSEFVAKPSPTLIAIGASTGGTRALADFLVRMPADCPGIVIVQHMPPAFTAPFAEHLDRLGPVRVKQAVSGDSVCFGQALVAPGGRHLLVVKRGLGFVVEVKDGPTVNRHRPSVDVLFKSTAESAGRRAIGVILTGMGDDGARCLKDLHDTGATTFAQDEASCVVFGMPKEAIRHGGVDRVLPLPELPAAVMAAVTHGRNFSSHELHTHRG